MTAFATVLSVVQTVVVTLLLDRRAQAAFAVALALMAGLLLGPDGVEAGKQQGDRLIITGGPRG